MELKEILGKTITKVYAAFGSEQGWLDTADCCLELNNELIIGFPFSNDSEVWLRELPADAEQLFKKTSTGMVIGRQITNFIWYEDASFGGYFLLDNGSLITETRMSPHGTGLAGLNYYKNLKELTDQQGTQFKKLTDFKTGS
jgi:hypothetical protein